MRISDWSSDVCSSDLGSFITPRNDRPQIPVDLAILSGEVGLDVVTFQDHPYQPAFLDTVTLLTWVAARTSRIHVSANVHSLPQIGRASCRERVCQYV